MSHILLYLIILFSIGNVSAQTIELVGEQIKKIEDSIPILLCTPVKITKSMKITKVTGNCNEFWIQKDSETIHRFINFIDPIGMILAPGIYYAYPKLKNETKKADIKVTLSAYKSG